MSIPNRNVHLRSVSRSSVYRRMPNGRLQFSWGVATELAAAQRRHRADEAPTAPVRQVDVTGAGSGSTVTAGSVRVDEHR